MAEALRPLGSDDPVKGAALLTALPALGYGLPCVCAIWYLADRGEVRALWGYPTYGAGPFENAGFETTVPLLVAFLLVRLAELVAAWLLWRHSRAGSVPLSLLPFELLFWIGFALGPPVFVIGVARTALVLMNWRSTSPDQPPAA